MDSLDRRILMALSEDARKPLARVAQELGVPQTTVHQRARRLEDHKIICGARLEIDWDQTGFPVLALVSIQTDEPFHLAEAVARFAEVPFVQGCYAITGEFDLMLVVRARSSSHLGEVLDSLRTAVRGRSRTQVVLATYFEGRMPPLADES